jgi:hypothetical protein
MFWIVLSKSMDGFYNNSLMDGIEEYCCNFQLKNDVTGVLNLNCWGKKIKIYILQINRGGPHFLFSNCIGGL